MWLRFVLQIVIVYFGFFVRLCVIHVVFKRYFKIFKVNHVLFIKLKLKGRKPLEENILNSKNSVRNPFQIIPYSLKHVMKNDGNPKR